MARILIRPRRVAAATALTVLVLAVHLWLAGGVLESRLGSGAADTRPQRIDVAFVRELEQSAPAKVAPRPQRRKKAAPAAAASAPEPAASAPELAVSAPAPAASAPELAASVPDVAASAPAEEPPALAEAPTPPASAASAAAAFEWPPSTRLAYVLTGNYRGPVDGQAQVEWLRSGTHYQVHLEVSIGPPFAPLISRHIASDGELGESGLQPQRYDEETRVLLREPHRLTIFFDAGQIRLPNGYRVPSPAGVQDSASQFVQLTWLFTTQPQLLEPGRSIDIPLALARYVDVWTYDVLARETLFTPVGAVEAVHVKPRREPRSGELTAEMWIAPSLEYLPVRIVIRQDADTFVDLLITRLPLQAAPAEVGREPGPPAAPASAVPRSPR
jgi:hypothetical protein